MNISFVHQNAGAGLRSAPCPTRKSPAFSAGSRFARPGENALVMRTARLLCLALLLAALFGAATAAQAIPTSVTVETTYNSFSHQSTKTIRYSVNDPVRGAVSGYATYTSTDNLFSTSWTVDAPLVSQDGLVTWHAHYVSQFIGSEYPTQVQDTVTSVIYNPARGRWETNQQPYDVSALAAPSLSTTWSITDLRLQNATVYWTATSRNQTFGNNTYYVVRGYDGPRGLWYAGFTKPLAYYVSSATSGMAPLNVAFTNDSLAATSYSWQFGDGASNAAPNTTHVFTRAGTYTVTLTVFGPGGQHSLSTTINVSSPPAPPGAPRKAPSDFDGDGRTDLAVWRPSNGTWYAWASRDGYMERQFGQNGDIPVSGDFDGDGKTDLAVWRPSNGTWYTWGSRNGYTERQFGQFGDIPISGDFDGDGKTDLAVWRPIVGTWYIWASRDGYMERQFGQNGDIPISGDFDGDGKTDLTVWRPSNGTWYTWGSRNGYTERQFGQNGDIPISGDFDGDGRTDLAVWRPSNGTWYAWASRDGYMERQFGQNGDIPVSGDFDGDGRTDLAVWRPLVGTWYVWGSHDGYIERQFGQNGDIPVSYARKP